MGENKWQIDNKKSYLEQSTSFSQREQIIPNEILWSKLLYIGQITLFQNMPKTKLKSEYAISSGTMEKQTLPET